MLTKLSTGCLLLGLTLTTVAISQDAPTPPPPPKKEKKENIIIRKKGDGKEKMTIIVDGDKVTINGKPVENMKDADFEILRSEDFDMLPQLGNRIAPMVRMKMLGNGNESPINRAFLGVISTNDEKGAKITTVNKESPAAKAGLQVNDIITKVGDTNMIKGGDDLFKAIGKYQPGDQVSVIYLRDNKELKTMVTLEKNPNPAPRIMNMNRNFNFNMPDMPALRDMKIQYNSKPKLGLEIQDVEEGKGVKVLDVDEDMPAAKAGLQKDDIITEVDGASIASVDELKTKISHIKDGDHLKLGIQRKGKNQEIDVKIPKKLKTADL